VSHLVDERPVAPGQTGQAGEGGQAGPSGQRHWYRWILPTALVLAVMAGAVGLATGVASWNPAVRSPAVRLAAPAAAGPAVVRVLSSTGQVRGGPSFPAVNGIASGLGRLWLTGGGAGQNHLLYALDPVTSRIDGRVALPSRLVMNPGDVATGSGAAWVAVGASVYRVGSAHALTGGAVAHAFATLPRGGIVGDLAVDAGAVWATDMAHGKVYRFAASTGRLEAVVPVGATAGAMAVGDGGVWVADAYAHAVSRISVTRNRVDSVLTVPGVPSHIAATDSGLWVTDGTGGVVTDLEGTAGRAVTVRVGREPTGLAASGDTVWVANTADGTLSRIDARRHMVVATVPVGTRPYAVAADWRGAWVALLGTPVMMHTSPATSPSAGPWARLRVCGGLH